jgi:hypothetical protein
LNIIINFYLELHGYVISYHSEKSKAGNEFFDLTIKSTENSADTVRIMKNSNKNISNHYLNDLKRAGTPLAFQNLSPSASGIYFFNSFRGCKIITSNLVSFPFDVEEKTTI